MRSATRPQPRNGPRPSRDNRADAVTGASTPGARPVRSVSARSRPRWP
jgi:hypothetical protein